MRRRLWRWLRWTVVLSVAPYIGVFLVQTWRAHQPPHWSVLFGAGQLLLTSVAMTAAGIREIAGVETTERMAFREFMLWASTIFVLLTGMFYGATLDASVGGRPTTPADPDELTKYSAGAFALSMVIGGCCVAAATPKPKPSGG